MEINSQIFKAYDIRGNYPDQIDEKTANLLGKGLVSFLDKENPNIIVGRDGRLSSPALSQNLIEGILESGGNVTDIGLSTSPMLYWATAFYGFDGGVEVTASHNPPQDNGFKLLKKEAIPIDEDSGLKQIKGLIEQDEFSKGKGKLKEKDILNDYVEFNLNFLEEKLAPLKLIIDTGNSVSGVPIPPLFKNMKLEVSHIFSKLDGHFPNHLPDTSQEENLEPLQDKVLEQEADLGVAFDGDGDRIRLVDNRGKIISADLVLALLSEIVLKENPGGKILYDLRCSRVVPQTIERYGGKPVISRVGRTFIINKMREENIVFGGELSAHYYSKQNFFCETPFFALFKVLEEMSRTQKYLSELIEPFNIYSYSGEINFKVKRKESVLKRLGEEYSEGEISKIDGLKVNFEDWWFIIRASHTEPVLRLIIEAENKKKMDQKKKELTNFISKFQP